MADTMHDTDRWAMAPAGLLEVGDPWAPTYDGRPTAAALMPATAGVLYTVPGATMGTDGPWIGTEFWCATGTGAGAVWDALESKRTRDDGEQLGSGRAWRRPLKGRGPRVGYSGKFEPSGDAPDVADLVDQSRRFDRVELRPLEVQGRPVSLTSHDGDALTAFLSDRGDVVAVRSSQLAAVARVIGASGSGPWMVTGSRESTISRPVTIAPGADRAIGSTPTVALIMPVRLA